MPRATARSSPGAAIKEGDWLSIDGEAGAIYLGHCNVVVERPDAELAEIERWRSEVAGTFIIGRRGDARHRARHRHRSTCG